MSDRKSNLSESHTKQKSSSKIINKNTSRLKIVNSNYTQHKPIKVRAEMTERENKAINKLKAYNDKVSKQLKILNKEKDKSIQNEKVLRSQINAEFHNLINLIYDKRKKILNDLSKVSFNIQTEIYEQTQKIKQRQTQIINSLKTCQEIVENSNVNKSEREEEIVKMVNDAVPQNINQFQTKTLKASSDKTAISKVN